MELKDIAQWYYHGEQLRKKGIENKDFALTEFANKMMYDAVKEFQKSKQSQESLFDEVDRLAKLNQAQD